jgi:hypothetical protein
VGYSQFIDAQLDAVDSILAPSGIIIGAVFHTSAGDMRAEVEADDLYVQVS